MASPNCTRTSSGALSAAAPEARAEVFRDYLTVHFRLEQPEEMGLTGEQRGHRKNRAKANYLRDHPRLELRCRQSRGGGAQGLGRIALRPDAALPRRRRCAIRRARPTSRYLEMRSQGLYGTNALEAQLDLLYAFCQFELARRHHGART